MKYRKLAALGLLLVMVCTGCGSREDGADSTKDSSPKSVSEETTESTKKTQDTGNTQSAPDPDFPRTKEEQEEKMGKTKENGQWIPPKGSYVDPESGTILNEDGVAIGPAFDEEYYQTHPGSQG